MPRIKPKSGDIFQIALPNKLGFAFAKCINLLEINSNARYPILLRVFNYRSPFLAPLDEIIKKDLILCPLLIAGILPAIKSGAWKFIENIPIEKNEIIVPHYKKGEPDEENVKDWYYVVDADISKKIISKFENVKHLETIGATGAHLVGTKIGMALLQDEGKKIEDYFNLEEYYEKYFYKEVTQIPAYYKQPIEMRGRAIEN